MRPERQIIVHAHGLAFNLVMRLGRTIATVQRAEAVPNWEAEGGEASQRHRRKGTWTCLPCWTTSSRHRASRRRPRVIMRGTSPNSSKAAGSQSSAPIDMEIAIAADRPGGPQAGIQPGAGGQARPQDGVGHTPAMGKRTVECRNFTPIHAPVDVSCGTSAAILRRHLSFWSSTLTCHCLRLTSSRTENAPRKVEM